MKNLVIIALVIAVGVLGYASFSRTPRLGAVLPSYTVTNASSSCGTTVSTLLSPDTSIQVRNIYNTSTGTVYLWFSATSTGFTSAAGTQLLGVGSSSAAILMSDISGNLWNGTVFCKSASGTSTLTYTQW